MQNKVISINENKYQTIQDQYSDSESDGYELIIAFNQKDVNAFTIIYKKLFPSVYYYAKRFVGNEDAQDLTADVFTKLWNADKRFPSLQSIKSYLQVSVRNAAINFNEHLRIIEKNTEGVKSLNEIIIDDFNSADEIRATQLNLVLTAIQKLPLQQKKVFELFYLMGLKEKEIALKLNVALRTVHNHKMIALKKMRLIIPQLNCLYILFLFFR